MMNTNEIIRESLIEDIGEGDKTTLALDFSNEKCKANILSKDKGILCGTSIVKEVFKQVDKNIKVEILKNDGDKINPKEIVISLYGSKANILKGERVALNFLQRLSGISTKTNEFVSKVKHAKIFDTRKTTPLLRNLEKMAVRIGGGENHRFGLYDKILIKDNHVFSCGGVKNALKIVQKKYPKETIEIEVKSYYEFMEALSNNADIILLDNMKPKEIKDCLAQIKNFKPIIEVSGNINIDNVKKYDIKDVDRISVGQLTHSVRSLDFSLIIMEN